MFIYNMTSYIWRSTDATFGLGPRPESVDVIEFTVTNTSDGKHMRDTTLQWIVGFSENERPKQGFNQFQDTGVNSLTFTITGHIENPKNNDIFQLVKVWLIEEKQNDVFTKGRFGLELDNITDHNVTPASTGTTDPTRPEQSRGLMLVSWSWIQTGEWPSKADFEAEFKFVGDHGTNIDGTPYDWTALVLP